MVLGKVLIDRKKNVLIIGPYPPTLGGVTVECLTLTQTLRTYAEDIAVEEFNTNRKFFTIVSSVPKVIGQIFRSDAIFIYGSQRRVCLFCIVFIPLCKILRRRVVVKITGGNLFEYFDSSSYFYQNILGLTLFKAHTVFLETKYLVEKFGNKYSNVHWFPMTRIGDDKTFGAFPLKSTASVEIADKSTSLKVVYLGYVCVPKGVPLLLDASDALESVSIDVFGEFRANGGPLLNEGIFKDRSASYRGVVTPSELPLVIAGYDVLVLPTHYSGEGYPGVLIEAKRAGLAVVSTKWKSIPEIINHNVDGLLIDPGSLEQLIDSLQKLQDDRELLTRIKSGSHDSFANFDSRNWCSILLEKLVGF